MNHTSLFIYHFWNLQNKATSKNADPSNIRGQLLNESLEPTTRPLAPLRMKPEMKNVHINLSRPIRKDTKDYINVISNTYPSEGSFNKFNKMYNTAENFGNLQTIPSRKCTVLDLLFDREVSVSYKLVSISLRE